MWNKASLEQRSLEIIQLKRLEWSCFFSFDWVVNGFFFTHLHVCTHFSTRSCCMSVNRSRWRPPGSTAASSSLWALIHISQTTRLFSICFFSNCLSHIQVQPSSYCTFYDDQRQNWSLMFESENAATDFCKEVCILWVLSVVLHEELLMQ